jgi:serine/threonine-protein kinase
MSDNPVLPTIEHTAYNLLFGLLALQNNFISRDLLVAAFGAWVADKSQELDQILLRQGHLDAEGHAVLTRLVGQHLKLHGDNPQESLAELSAMGTVLRRLSDLGDTDVAASIGYVTGTHITDRDGVAGATSSFVGDSTFPGGRFRVLRLHAEGGLGEVYVARDEEVHREVALKQIKAGFAGDLQNRARFLVEAEITGGLEHPGIVPVYGLGTYPDGRPFYAMRLIRGVSLKEAIAQFHNDQATQNDRGRRALALQKLLRRFLDVCNAMSYAHSRGVLHRDLKPSNIMLGDYGETLVVDWGLAKAIGHHLEPASSPGPGEPTLTPESGSALQQTIAGRRLGTPGYMSPEQAGGRIDELSARSDVYSLGATLYAILTGRPPFIDADLPSLLRQVERGEFPSPRQIRRWVGPALDAVCLKAMALQAENRYDSPRAMAEDIEHWLADEPVSAHRENRSERLARWLRRHRTWARAAAVALFLVAVISTGASISVRRAWKFEQAARKAEQLVTLEIGVERDRAQTAYKKADANFVMAREAVNRLLTQLAEKGLAAIPEAEELRRQVAADAAEFNERFLSERPLDPVVRSGAAQVFREVANINRMLGRFTEAVDAYSRSVALLKSLASEFPDKPAYRDQLAETLFDAGESMRMEGRPQSAEPFLREAVAIADQVLSGAPHHPGFRRTKAGCLSSLASVLVETGRFADAQVLDEQAVALLRPLVEVDGSSYLNQIILAMTLTECSQSFREGGKPQVAEPRVAEAIKWLNPLLDQPLDRKRLGKIPEGAIRDNARFILALAQTELGLTVSADPARRTQAIKEFDAAIDGLLRQGAAKSPIAGRRKALGLAYIGRAGCHASGGALRLAEPDWIEARKLLEKLAANFPRNAGFRGPLALASGQIARLLLEHGDKAAARPLFEQAIGHHRQSLEANPESPADRQALPVLLKELELAGGSASQSQSAR